MKAVYIEMHRWMASPFIWGETDCMLSLADWVQRVHGVDPAADIRGTYDSRGSCQRETGFLRDPIAAVERCLASIGGLPRVEAPQEGDVGLIVHQEPDGRSTPCGALWLGAAWGCKGLNGATTVKPGMAKVMTDAKGPAIWGVGYAP